MDIHQSTDPGMVFNIQHILGWYSLFNKSWDGIHYSTHPGMVFNIQHILGWYSTFNTSWDDIHQSTDPGMVFTVNISWYGIHHSTNSGMVFTVIKWCHVNLIWLYMDLFLTVNTIPGDYHVQH